jgi:hypothetical protein
MKKLGTTRNMQEPSFAMAIAIGLIGLWVFLRMKLTPRWAMPPG